MPQAEFEAMRTALAIAAGYLWQRRSFRNPECKLLWSEVKPPTPYSVSILTDIRKDPTGLSVEQVLDLREVMKRFIAIPDHKMAILSEYYLIKPIFDAAGLSESLFDKIVDLRHNDSELLSILEIGKSIPPNQPTEILDLLGGMWHVLRSDTSPGEDEFNVGILNIKPLVFYHKSPAPRGIEAVISGVPRFSFRARGKFKGDIQEFRGIVVEIEGIIHFFATREDNTPRLLLMTWTKPSWRSRDVPHADIADGIIMSVNADAKPIVAPVAAQFISHSGGVPLYNRSYVNQHADRLRAGIFVEPSDDDTEEMAFWHEQTTNGAARAKRYTRSQLAKLSGFNPFKPIDDVIDRLALKARTGPLGYFEL